MKRNVKYITLILATLVARGVYGQLLDPADWEFGQVTNQVGETQEITLHIILRDSWYIYSNDQDPDLGPRPTEVNFDSHPSYELVGELQPLKVKEKYDDVWMGNVRYIDQSGGGFVQKVKILQSNPIIRGNIIYSICSMETGQCIFPEEHFEIRVINP